MLSESLFNFFKWDADGGNMTTVVVTRLVLTETQCCSRMRSENNEAAKKPQLIFCKRINNIEFALFLYFCCCWKIWFVILTWRIRIIQSFSNYLHQIELCTLGETCIFSRKISNVILFPGCFWIYWLFIYLVYANVSCHNPTDSNNNNSNINKNRGQNVCGVCALFINSQRSKSNRSDVIWLPMNISIPTGYVVPLSIFRRMKSIIPSPSPYELINGAWVIEIPLRCQYELDINTHFFDY